jgi:DNA-binding transcriptional MerR regulator
MRISEPSTASGVPIPTIKFYLREGLLSQGLVAPNQAEYREEHLRRLRLIRALAEVGGIPLGTVREVLQAVDDPTLPMHEALGTAHQALGPDLGQEDDPAVAEARAEVDRFLEELGWTSLPAARGGTSSPWHSPRCGGSAGRTPTRGSSPGTRGPPTDWRPPRSRGPPRRAQPGARRWSEW